MFSRSVVKCAKNVSSASFLRFNRINGNVSRTMPLNTQPKHVRTIVQLADVKNMAVEYNEMNSDVISILATLGDQGAREERLIREIMKVDNAEWNDAKKTFDVILIENRRGGSIITLPYKIGLFAAVTGAFLSVPMVFYQEVVMGFNEQFVTTDVPDDKDLETWLEVGAWAWNWMEPPLGTISFALLCLQFARSQLQNLHWAPYTELMKRKRAERIIRRFPKYDPEILESFSVGDRF